MVQWKLEGIAPKNGLNVYKPSDPSNAGFIIKAGYYQFRFRWSKKMKKLFCGFN